MVALLSLSLPIRPDADRANNELKAQTIVTKFRIQHNAFKRYIESKKLTLEEQKSGAPERVVYYSGLGYRGGHMMPSKVSGMNIPAKGFRNTQGMEKPFVAEDEAKIVQDYLPFGYDKVSNNIVSKVFCFATAEGETYNYERVCEQDTQFMFDATTRDDCCAKTNVDVYVISWQQMPRRWIQSDPSFKDMKVSQPVADMMSVIAKSDGYGYSFGYVTYLKDVSDSKVNGYNRLQHSFATRIMSGGMYRALKSVVDENGNPTGEATEEMGYRPIFNVLLNDEDFRRECATVDGIINPCLIAMNKVNNREEEK